MADTMREFFRIVFLCVAAAVGYGVAHDQVSVLIAPEYLVDWHPRLFGLRQPQLVALAWGVVATWWVGAGAGIALAVSSRAGSWPKLGAADLRGGVAATVAATAASALAGGLLGYAVHGSIDPGFLRGYVSPEERMPRLAPVAFSHFFAYQGAFLAGLVLCAATLARRRRRARAALQSP
ncbi:MAG: hypothetical protein SF028_02100 [Candidatus Sumerlaeia bacterium]|nr:hypothetical protein [Candidatus Sumerlaeia bacterium]